MLELSFISFFCAVLVLIPLPSFWRVRNGAILSLIGWLAMGNIINGINTVIWSGTVKVKYRVWCDISEPTRLAIGSHYAIPASLLCLCRYLAFVASGKNEGGASNTVDKRWQTVLELIAGVGLPVLGISLHFFIQDARFDILEDFGCFPTVYLSVPSMVIFYLPPIILSFVTMVYAGLALVHLIRRRIVFNRVPQNSPSRLMPGAHFRLVALPVVEMLCAEFLSIWTLILSLEEQDVKPWVGWESTREKWYNINQTPRSSMLEAEWNRIQSYWYIVPFASVTFFVFFGCGRAVYAEYLEAWRWVRQHAFRIQTEPRPILPLSLSGKASTNSSTTMVSSSTTSECDDCSGSTHTDSRLAFSNKSAPAKCTLVVGP